MTEIVLQNGETWLVCGGRDFGDKAMFDSAMRDLMRLRGCPHQIVHGAARGADSLADIWAFKMAIPVIRCRADWQTHGKAAGPIRNQEMLKRHNPKLVVAFPGGRGTADMVEWARKAGVDVAEIRVKEPTP